MALLSSALLWLTACLLVGLLANRLPERWLQGRQPGPEPSLVKPQQQREGSRDWLHIRRWKRWIPDAGAALPGGVAKASLVRRDPAALQQLVRETRRAELVHWSLLPLWTLTALWLPPAGVLVNLLFACLFNLPCLLLQRYNRQRIESMLRRHADLKAGQRV